MKIVIDKESIIKAFAVAFYAVSGGDYSAVKDVVKELLEKIGYEPYEERSTGEWIRDKVAFYLECSECGCDIRDANTCFLTDEDALNFCPNCGADMRGGKE